MFDEQQDIKNSYFQALFRKQPSEENPCHTTPAPGPLPPGSSSDSVRHLETTNGSTSFSKLNR